MGMRMSVQGEKRWTTGVRNTCARVKVMEVWEECARGEVMDKLA